MTTARASGSSTSSASSRRTSRRAANAIFALGDELAQVLRGGARPKSITLRVAVVDSVPKLLTVALLQLLIDRHRKELELVCREGAYADLLGQVAAGQLDAMLADAAVPANLARSLHASVLADSGMSFVAAPTLTAALAKRFPSSFDGAPFLAGSAPTSPLGQAIEAWFARHGVRPHIVGRIDDSALLKGFAQRGLGVAIVPTSVAKEVMRQYQLGIVGRTDEVRQAVFLIRARGRRTHPLIAELEELHHMSARSGNRP